MTGSDDAPLRLILPPVLDSAAAVGLADRFQAARGRPVRVDAGGVTLLGGLCLQVLLSAARTWRADRLAYAVGPASADFLEQSRLLGAEHLNDTDGATA